MSVSPEVASWLLEHPQSALSLPALAKALSDERSPWSTADGVITRLAALEGQVAKVVAAVGEVKYLLASPGA